jgi:dihydrofolate synthase/folylpolyglutamate synthase
LTVIDSLLAPYQRFGVNLGLERSRRLLARLGDPQKQVPFLHVGGSNGKGSVCAYLSTILSQAGYRVGRYTSPHLLHWHERICLNEQAIADADLAAVLRVVCQTAPAHQPDSPTLFEIFTAAAWLYFAQQQVDVAVMEVGLGGRLDATNVADSPLVTVITSLSWEHWQVLGPTLADIAREKAGILKPHRPAILGSFPPEAKAVIAARVLELNCPARWPSPARALVDGEQAWAQWQNWLYPLPLLGDVQLLNSALALAAVEELQHQGWAIPPEAIVQAMTQVRWPGRLQWLSFGDRPLLLDGAHNTAAAQALAQYAHGLAKPVQWLVGMLDTKEHQAIFQALLRPGDRLYLLPVPAHKSADPQYLASLALQVCSALEFIQLCPDTPTAIGKALQAEGGAEFITVLCGSLYLVGDCLKYHHSLSLCGHGP